MEIFEQWKKDFLEEFKLNDSDCSIIVESKPECRISYSEL